MEDGFAKAMLEALPQPALFVAADARVGLMNAGARRLLGEIAQGRHFALSLRQPAAIAVIEAAVRDRVAGQARVVVPGAAGGETVFRLLATPVAGDGRAGALCLLDDISEAEHVVEMRRDFVANVSHELRTPLTALLGFIETLQGAARDDAAARGRFLAIMSREAERMNRLVRDLLQLSQVEATERLRPGEPVDLRACVTTVVATLRNLAEAKGAKVTVEGLAGPVIVPGDPDQMVQVFQNLIENALKYGDGGKVHVTLSRDTVAVMGGSVIHVAVSDSGEGIDSLHLPRLTERFYRVDSHRSREQGGTGLGLAIVKHIVNRHRGRLRIESVPGQGSTFTVTLPEH
jgi:two-component system phosphate regulon sensor histidine kinase PhoR